MKKKSKFVGLENMANKARIPNSKKKNKELPKPKKEPNPITGKFD